MTALSQKKLIATDRTREILGFFLALYPASIANWWWGWLRFGSSRANYIFMVLTFASPVFALVAAFRLKHRLLRIVCSAVLTPITVASALLCFALIAVMMLWVPDVTLHNIDYSFERLREVPIGEEHFIVFRTNGGATTDFGIVVRREEMVLPGLFRINNVCEWYPAADVQIARISGEIVRCEFPEYGTRHVEERRVDVALPAG